MNEMGPFIDAKKKSMPMVIWVGAQRRFQACVSGGAWWLGGIGLHFWQLLRAAGRHSALLGGQWELLLVRGPSIGGKSFSVAVGCGWVVDLVACFRGPRPRGSPPGLFGSRSARLPIRNRFSARRLLNFFLVCASLPEGSRQSPDSGASEPSKARAFLCSATLASAGAVLFLL